jgi:hypothetical protein
MEREVRSAAEVRSILENAKLELKDLLPVSQVRAIETENLFI